MLQFIFDHQVLILSLVAAGLTAILSQLGIKRYLKAKGYDHLATLYVIVCAAVSEVYEEYVRQIKKEKASAYMNTIEVAKKMPVSLNVPIPKIDLPKLSIDESRKAKQMAMDKIKKKTSSLKSKIANTVVDTVAPVLIETAITALKAGVFNPMQAVKSIPIAIFKSFKF